MADVKALPAAQTPNQKGTTNAMATTPLNDLRWRSRSKQEDTLPSLGKTDRPRPSSDPFFS